MAQTFTIKDMEWTEILFSNGTSWKYKDPIGEYDITNFTGKYILAFNHVLFGEYDSLLKAHIAAKQHRDELLMQCLLPIRTYTDTQATNG